MHSQTWPIMHEADTKEQAGNRCEHQVCVSILQCVFVPVMWCVLRPSDAPRVLALLPFFFFSKWPSFSEPLCDSSAISGSHLPFMCGGPDRITSISPLPTPHTWDTLAVVCHHNGIQQAFSRGTIAYSPPFSISQVHSQGNKWRDTNTHMHTHKISDHIFCTLCTFANYHQFSA